MLAIIKAGSTHPHIAQQQGDFEQMIQRGLGVPASQCEVIEITNGGLLPMPETVEGLVITGAHHMISERPAWLEDVTEWVLELVFENVPTLGICFGHQLIAHAMGGVVDKNPNGPRIGTVAIQRDCERSDPLFGTLPPIFPAHVAHYESVLTLPSRCRSLGRGDHDDNQMFKVGDFTWCVQFHPEFDANVCRAYIEANRESLQAQGQDPAQMLSQVQETPAANAILSRFAQLVFNH